MAGDALSNVGATEEHLDQGQSTSGAPKAPDVPNAPPPSKEEPAKAKEPSKKDEPPVEKPKEDEPVVAQWHEWEDPSAQAAVELLKEQGVSPAEADAIFAKAIDSGDLRDIDVKALEAKVGKTKALLIMNGVRDYHTRHYVQVEQTVAEIKGMFGGDAGWESVKTWAQAKEKKDPSFKKELDSIRVDLDKGGRAAKAAAKDLLNLYNAAPNTKGLANGNLVKGDGGTPSDVSPLTRAEYVELISKAHAQGNMALVSQLNARRQAGMKKGI